MLRQTKHFDLYHSFGEEPVVAALPKLPALMRRKNQTSACPEIVATAVSLVRSIEAYQDPMIGLAILVNECRRFRIGEVAQP